MSSIKSQLFLALSAWLMQKLQSTDEIPSCQWVDKDYGQDKLLQDGVITMPLPAVLISFPTSQYDGQLSGDQNAQTNIRIKTLFENYADSFEGSINQVNAVNFFEFNERVHNAVKDFTLSQMSGLVRTSDEEDDDHNNIIVTSISYTCNLFNQASDNTTLVSANPVPGYFKNLPIDPTKPVVDTGFVLTSPNT